MSVKPMGDVLSVNLILAKIKSTRSTGPRNLNIRTRDDGMSREKQIIERIKESLVKEGITEKVIHGHSKYGIGSPKSYLEALVDIKLEGREIPTAQETWEEMKLQLNYLTHALLKASDDYSKLETRIRGAESDARDLLKEESHKENKRKVLFDSEAFREHIDALKSLSKVRTMGEPDPTKEKLFDEFYNSEKAQEYCFGNYNNATRDEDVGRFSFNAGYDAGKEETKQYNEKLVKDRIVSNEILAREILDLKTQFAKKESTTNPNVFLLRAMELEGWGDNNFLIGVFSSREKAEAAYKSLQPCNSSRALRPRRSPHSLWTS